MTREKAIEMCKSIKHYLTSGNPVWSKEEVAEAMTMAIEALNNERQEGHWITYKDEHLCSVCKGVVTDEWYHEDDAYDYCPWCRADMKGADDED